MKSLLLVALTMVTISCGKSKSGSSAQQEREVNPITGQVELLRSMVVSEVFINESDRTVTLLESKSSSPQGDGAFSCPLVIRAGSRWNYDVISDGRTLMLMRNRSGEYYTRPEINSRIFGTWTQMQYTAGMTIKTSITFPNARSMSILQECSRRYY